MNNNEEEHKAQKEQGAGDPESELGMRGFKVLIFEGNKTLGKKIIISGGLIAPDKNNIP